jgi:hypothetical protein
MQVRNSRVCKGNCACSRVSTFLTHSVLLLALFCFYGNAGYSQQRANMCVCVRACVHVYPDKFCFPFISSTSRVTKLNSELQATAVKTSRDAV